MLGNGPINNKTPKSAKTNAPIVEIKGRVKISSFSENI
jgi:hypothetical protein